MTTIVSMLLWLVVPSLLPAVALIGKVPQVPFLAGLITAVMAAGSGALSILTSSSLIPWIVTGVVAANLLASWFLFRRRSDRAFKECATVALILLGVCLLPLLSLQRLPVDWDARSIWLLHGRWFYAGGSFVREAIRNPALAFSHGDYPPLIPATLGAVWRFGGRINLPQGQTVIALLNVFAIALLALGIAELFQRSPTTAAAWASFAALAFFGLGGIYATNGYADVLWSTALCASAFYLLVVQKSAVHFKMGAVLGLVAALTKNEGLVACLLVFTFAAVRYRRARYILGLGATGGLALAWLPIIYFFGASGLLEQGDFLALLEADPSVWSRTGPPVVAIFRLVAPLAATALICAVVSVAVLLKAREALKLGSPLWSWLTLLGVTLALVAAYAISPDALVWHLETSVKRTTIVIRLLLMTEIAVWGAVAVEELRRSRSKKMGTLPLNSSDLPVRG